MAFQTGTSTSIENLLQQLSTFLVANGWTEDFANTGDPGNIGFSKNSIFVAMQYTEASDGGTMAMYQNTSNDDSVSVWLSTGDSNIGAATLTATSFDTQRCVNIFAGPHTAYWFFENDSGPAYCHVVVEVDAGRFRHFGFGEIVKVGDWVGGEYCYGHQWDQQASRIDSPAQSFHGFGLDNFAANAPTKWSLRIQGMPQQAGAETWALGGYIGSFPNGVDRAGEDRGSVFGAWRGGTTTMYSYHIPLDVLTAFKALAPMSIWWNDNSLAPDQVIFLGTQADVRAVNIANLDPGETFVIAGETWYVFPWVRKQFLQNNTEESWNGGVAYRREDA